MNNNEKRNVTIRLADYYPHNCSEQKYVKVTKSTERYMRRWEIREESRARKDRRYGLRTFDEVIMGECEGACTPSHEKDICCYTEIELLHIALGELPDYEKELIEHYYFGGMKLLDLSEMYGISKSAIARHIKKARNMMKKTMLSYMEK